MRTRELTMNDLDDEPTASVEKDAAFLNSTAAPEHVRWTVIRMKLQNCACYPIDLNFEIPLTEAAVREKIASGSARRSGWSSGTSISGRRRHESVPKRDVTHQSLEFSPRFV